MTFQKRIFLLVSFIAVVVGLASAWITVTLMTTHLEEAQFQHADSVVNVLKEPLALQTINRRFLESRRHLQEIVRDNEAIVFAFITGFDGKVFSHSFQDGFPKALLTALHHPAPSHNGVVVDRFQTSSGPLLVVGHLFIPGMRAHIHLGFDQTLLFTKVDKARWQILFVTFGMIAIGILLAWFLTTGLNRPLKRLVDSLHSFANDNDGGVAFPTSGYPDLDEVKKAFDLMVRERQKIEESLDQAKKEAQSANLAKTEFLANMSHEIRTPLNTISGFAQILLGDKGEVTNDLKPYLQSLRNASDLLSEIVHNILDLSKIEAGKLAVEEEEVDIRLLIKGVFQIHKPNAENRNIRFNFQVAPHLARFIRTDRTKLNQILTNLITNAIKFTPEGREIKIHADNHGSELVLAVVDQGIGIPSERLTAVFEPFEQAAGSTSRKYGGAGLGLSIVRKLVTLLGGEVRVESEVGRGSTFTVRLPLVKVVLEELETSKLTWASYRFSNNARLLLVEDDAMNREMMLAVLKEVRLLPEIAEDGAEAVEKARQVKPDLILMDLHLPEMDGLTAARMLRDDPETAHIPIVGLSADAFVERREQAKDAGVVEYLTKPIDLDVLFPILVRYLGSETEAGPSAIKVSSPNADAIPLGRVRPVP